MIKNNDRRSNRYIYICLFLLFIVFSVFISIQGATAGNELTELEEGIRDISKENQELSKKLVESSSLYEKANEAEKRGFVKPTNIVYLDGEVSVATLR